MNFSGTIYNQTRSLKRCMYNPRLLVLKKLKPIIIQNNDTIKNLGYLIFYKLYFGNKEEPKSLSIVQNMSPNIKQIDTEEIDI